MTDIKRRERKRINITDSSERMPEESPDEEYDTRIRNHKIRTRSAVVTVILVIAVMALIIAISSGKESYSSYNSLGHVTVISDGQCFVKNFGNGFVKITRDGISAYNTNCEYIWDETFEISDLEIDICGDYLVAVDKGGLNMYLIGKDGLVRSIRTNLKILKAVVSETGNIAAILEDTSADYIRMFDRSGNVVSDIKVVLTQTGTPVSLDISPSGEYMVVSYVTVSSMSLESSVVFYNFKSAGQDVSQKLIGGFSSEGIVPSVHFIGSSTVCAFAENEVVFYSVGRNVEEIKKNSVDDKICKIFYSSKHVGLLTMSDDGKYKVVVYSPSGTGEMTYTPDEIYDSYGFSDSNLYMYSDRDVKMIDMSGKTIYENTFSDDLIGFEAISGDRYYLYATSSIIERIRLR